MTQTRDRVAIFIPRFREWLAAGYAGLAAQIAFYFLLSIFPALLLVSAILAFLPNCNSYYLNVQTLLNTVLPPSSADLVNHFLEQAKDCGKDSGGAFSLGLILLLVVGSNVFAVITVAMNRAYGLEDPRPFWKRRLMAIAFFLGAVAIGAVSLSSFFFGGALGEAWQLALVPLTTMAAGLGLTALYLFGPGWRVKFSSAAWGAFIAVAGVIVVSWVFQFFVRDLARYELIYGAIAALIVLMIWMYLVSFVVLLGGLVVVVRQRRQNE